MLGAAVTSDECINTKHLLEWLFNDLECAVHIPCLCVSQHRQLLVCVENQVTEEVNLYVLDVETVRDEVIGQLKKISYINNSIINYNHRKT
jgi:hypothetical protein